MERPADLIPTLREIRAELAKRDACPRHFFVPRPAGYMLGDKIACAHCGSKFTMTDAGHYVRGYAAAGGNTADVWPDWKPRT